MNCKELETYLTDYLEGDLDKERTDALLDHVEQCAACRAEFQAYQRQEDHLRRYFGREAERLEQSAAKHSSFILQPSSFDLHPSDARRSAFRIPRSAFVWAAAGLLMVMAGSGLWRSYRRAVPTGHAALAVVHEADGRVLAFDGKTFRRVKAGATIHQNQRLKVAMEGYLALTLPDGNIIEARGGTQLTLSDFPDRLEIVMRRGHIWAHLNTPPSKRFVVRTSHLTATAIGTVYGVEEGLDGSTVQVAQGVVSVESGGTRSDVKAPGFYASRDGVEPDVSDATTAWSRHQENLTALVEGVVPTPAAESVDVELASPPLAVGPATSYVTTRSGANNTPSDRDVVEFLPEDTLHLAEARDWQGLLAEFQGTDYAAFLQEESIREWWEAVGAGDIVEEILQETDLRAVIDLAKLIDGQLAVSVGSDGDVLLLAECGDNKEQITSLTRLLLATLKPENSRDPEVAPDGQAMVEPQSVGGLTLFIIEGRLVISSDADQASSTITRLKDDLPTDFVDGPFYRKIRDDVSRPRFIVASNLEGQLGDFMEQWSERSRSEEIFAMLDFLGLPSLDYLLFSPNFTGRGMNQAARLAFVEDGRYGAMDWLAEPAPMRGLDFFSPEVHLFAAAVVRNPRQMLLDYLVFLERTHPEREFEKAMEIANTCETFFEAFGGEIAIGLDSPILPIPNLKIAIEVIDRDAFTTGLALLIEAVRDEFETDQMLSFLETTPHGGRVIHSLVIDGLPIPITPAWAFVDDYFIAGPGIQFVRDSIDVHASGRSIANDSRLVSLLPVSSQPNLSLLLYQDIARSIPAIVREKITSKLDEDDAHLVPNLDFIGEYRAAGIAYAYARPWHIDFHLNTPDGIDMNFGMAVPLIAKWLMPRLNIGQVVTKVVEAQLGLEEMAEAVGKFVEANDRLPRELADIAHPVGEYIDRIPADPFALIAGETLRLIEGPAGGQITLYSIGPDGVDDRGAIEYNLVEQYDGPGDIVLRYPPPRGE